MPGRPGKPGRDGKDGQPGKAGPIGDDGFNGCIILLVSVGSNWTATYNFIVVSSTNH